jgi:hypothetical protein
VNFLLSGILAADYASAAGPAHLLKIGESLIRFPGAFLEKVLSEKLAISCRAVSDDQMAIMQYIDLYEKLLKGPIFVSSMQTARWQNDFCQDADQFDRSSGTQINIQYALR